MVESSLRRDEAGVEPLVMKLLAGVIFFGIALGIGIPLYMRLGAGISVSFQVSVSQSSITIGRPESGENSKTVTVEPIAGYDKQATLSASGVPSGVLVSFSPPSGVPEFYSAAAVTVDNSAALGTTMITIRAVGEDGTEDACSLVLTIE